MTQPPQAKRAILLKLCGTALWVGLAAGAFHAAYAAPWASCLMAVYLFALVQLARADTWRWAAYPGLAVGLLIAVGRLTFFWNIFSGGAAALWYIYAFWIALFVALARLCLRRLGAPAASSAPPVGTGTMSAPAFSSRDEVEEMKLSPRSSPQSLFARLSPSYPWLLIPFVWLGLEYFRSELYYLRFSWLNPGCAFGAPAWKGPLNWAGMYGLGFLLVGFACLAAFLWQKSRLRSIAILLLGTSGVGLWGGLGGASQTPLPGRVIRVAGMQMESPSEDQVLSGLDELLRVHPDAELLVLSEYTFDEPPPISVRHWCKEHHRYLIVGGKEPASNSAFYNTAFVVGPTGDVMFRQAKSVPIQFFKDGLPAPEQKLWNSPWGKLGLCVCYDLSYTRVTDRLVKLGAQALIVPTMDASDWGKRQHELHARVAPIRAAEYGLPIFRLASSGISQWVDHTGRVRAHASCPGDGEMLFATLELRSAGHLPFDRWLGPFAVGVTAAIVLWLSYRRATSTRLGPLAGSERGHSCPQQVPNGNALVSFLPSLSSNPFRLLNLFSAPTC